MARPLRISYPNAFYHVTCRGNDRRAIFRDDHDRTRFLAQLESALEIFSVGLHTYVLMSNHFHLIVETPKANLSEFMRQFNISYTGYYNRRHGRVGHLYQGRFKAIVVDKDSYLLELSRYVHLNPIRIKAKTQQSEAGRIGEVSRYRWKSNRKSQRNISHAATTTRTSLDPKSAGPSRSFPPRGRPSISFCLDSCGPCGSILVHSLLPS